MSITNIFGNESSLSARPEITKTILHPIISLIQKIVVYETKTKLYVVGCNTNNTTFRVLKIDRTQPNVLDVLDDGIEHTQEEVMNLVKKIEVSKGRGGSAKSVSAFGIVGFVRFLEGYYLILITKRRRVAAMGLHYIYKIEDTRMIYIPNESFKITHPDEARYLKMFQSIDLSSNFYFSYSYDITHTVQVNLAMPKNLTFQEPSTNLRDSFKDEKELFPPPESNMDWESSFSYKIEKPSRYTDYAVRSKPNRKFVWNLHLLSEVEKSLHPDWILYVMHGFISQSNLNVFGRPILVTLVARRSNKYAGTRFLKRGANFEGDVANEVETEQVVHDLGVSSTDHPRLSSFVQIRGSIPAHWSQDITKIVPKPTISFDLSDPYAQTAGRHFNQLLERYGSPIIILNLVKQRETKKHESTLSDQYSSDIKYLNLFLPPQHSLLYITFDMARKNKGKDAIVMEKLGKIALSAISKTGIYCSYPYSLQTGVIRVNCVDCLDRTNTAQFALGKCALALQLYTLGILAQPHFEFDTDASRLLEVLYEDHGDTLALQYGGSQLVHRIKTYRKTAPWTSQGNDIMQTLSRYYSNTFSDAEKQHAMNLFLGLFIPNKNHYPIWEQVTDYYLHHSDPQDDTSDGHRKPLTEWWAKEVLDGLPLPYTIRNKEVAYLQFLRNRDMELVDAFSDFHRTHEFTPLSDLYLFTMSHSLRDFLPHCVTDYSPFTVRGRPGRRREESGKGPSMKNPSVSGQCSTSSTNSSGSSTGESDDDDSKISDSRQSSPCKTTQEVKQPTSFGYLFPTMKKTYGTCIRLPPSKDMHIYKRYVVIGKRSIRNKHRSELSTTMPKFALNPSSNYSSDSSYEVQPPKTTEASYLEYKNYIHLTHNIQDYITPSHAEQYARYLNNQLYLFKPEFWQD